MHYRHADIKITRFSFPQLHDAVDQEFVDNWRAINGRLLHRVLDQDSMPFIFRVLRSPSRHRLDDFRSLGCVEVQAGIRMCSLDDLLVHVILVSARVGLETPGPCHRTHGIQCHSFREREAEVSKDRSGRKRVKLFLKCVDSKEL